MRSDTAQRHSASVVRVLEHVRVSADDSVTIRDLSRIAHCAPFHLGRVFRSVTGESIQRYLRKLRLEFAVNQLLCTDETIISIALRAGYQSHEAFTRAFQQRVGLLPSTLRAAFGVASRRERCCEVISELSSNLLAGRWFSLAMGRTPLPGGKMIFRSHFGPYNQIPDCWKHLYAKVCSMGIDSGHLQAVGIVYDHPLQCECVRYDACLRVGRGLGGRPDLAMQVIVDADCVVATHHGPYQLTPYTYMRLVNQCAIEGVGLPGQLPYYEIYGGYPPITDNSVHVDLLVPVADYDAQRLAARK